MDFLRSNIYDIDNFERKTIYNEEINNMEYSQIYEMLCEYEKKIINNENEINPYEIVQFFSGIIIDVINKLLKEFKTNISKYELLKVELTDRIIERVESDSVEECMKKASAKAKWCKENKE